MGDSGEQRKGACKVLASGRRRPSSRFFPSLSSPFNQAARSPSPFIALPLAVLSRLARSPSGFAGSCEYMRRSREFLSEKRRGNVPSEGRFSSLVSRSPPLSLSPSLSLQLVAKQDQPFQRPRSNPKLSSLTSLTRSLIHVSFRPQAPRTGAQRGGKQASVFCRHRAQRASVFFFLLLPAAARGTRKSGANNEPRH